jgi:hypothetical protein
MELIRSIFNNSGESSYFTYIFFLLSFVIFVFGTVALIDFMIGKIFNKQED